METEQEIKIPLLPISADKEYEEARKEALENALTKVAESLLDFDNLTEEEYKATIELYLSYVATRYGFNDGEMAYCIPEEFTGPQGSKAFVFEGGKTIFFNTNTIKKAKGIAGLASLIETIEHEFTHVQQEKRMSGKTYKKITNEDGLIFYIETLTFFDFLKQMIDIPKSRSHNIFEMFNFSKSNNNYNIFDDIKSRYYYSNPMEVEARKNSIEKLEELFLKLKEIHFGKSVVAELPKLV